MTMLYVLLTLCVLYSDFAAGEKPGFRIQVSQKGLDYVRDMLLPVATEKIKTAHISDFQKSVDSPIGHITFSLSKAKVKDADLSETSVKLETPSNVIATINNAVIAADADWHYRKNHWPHISDHGWVHISASEISITLNMGIGMSGDGKPTVSDAQCSVSVGKVTVTFHGGWSWLYNLFSGTISGSVKSALQDQVCPLVRKEVNNDLNQILETLHLQSDIDDYCYIDYSIVQPPVVVKDAFFINGKGEIFDKANPTECPSPKQDMPETVDSDRMVTLWVTEYMLNTAGYAYQNAGFLQYNVSNEDVAKVKYMDMTTTFFKRYLPALYETYPDKNLTLWVCTSKPVTFDVNKAGVSGRAVGTITWLVHVNDTLVPAFTLNAQLDLCVNLSVQLGSKSEIYLDLITVEPYIQLKSSNIGNFLVANLQGFLSLMREPLIFFLNLKLKHGIPLPSIDHVSFSGFSFHLEDGYIRIHSDIEYNPDDKLAEETQHHTFFRRDFKCKMSKRGGLNVQPAFMLN